MHGTLREDAPGPMPQAPRGTAPSDFPQWLRPDLPPPGGWSLTGSLTGTPEDSLREARHTPGYEG